jgi:hypothetical protein
MCRRGRLYFTIFNPDYLGNETSPDFIPLESPCDSEQNIFSPDFCFLLVFKFELTGLCVGRKLVDVSWSLPHKCCWFLF